MALPPANEAACQNAGDALGGCIPTVASALMNVTSGKIPRRNNGVGPGGFALILARFFTFIIDDEQVCHEPTGPISQLKPQTNMTEIRNAKQMSASENGLIILPAAWAEICRSLQKAYWFYNLSYWEYIDPIDC